MDLLKRVLNAHVAEVLPEPTPLDFAPGLSARLGCRVLLKREDLTPVFSFKLRGAYNRIASLSPSELGRGIITASAGNHAQGVAFACERTKTRCLVVMPETTPTIKLDAVRRAGAEVQLFGDTYLEAARHALEIAKHSGMIFIPPFDDPDVIAGQGTIALELLRQAPRDLSAIYVPVGGGGLAAGIAAVTKELTPHVRVVGVQPEDSDAMYQSLRLGERVELEHVGIFADGVAVKQVGKLTFELCQRYLDEIVRVSTDEICAAINDAFLDTRTVLEPAGALAIAGAKRQHAAQVPLTGSIACIASGANVPFVRLGYIAERVEVGEKREAILAVTIPEQPGSFRGFIEAIGSRAITEFNYRLMTRNEALIFVGLELADHADLGPLIAGLEKRGYRCVNLSDDDFAKSHVRHMVGGISPEARDEVLYSFEFPGRQGALREFLESVSGRWNISLFHYRNHGAAFLQAVCGFEVPRTERVLLESTLKRTGFTHRALTGSYAARFLLKREDLPDEEPP